MPTPDGLFTLDEVVRLLAENQARPPQADAAAYQPDELGLLRCDPNDPACRAAAHKFGAKISPRINPPPVNLANPRKEDFDPVDEAPAEGGGPPGETEEERRKRLLERAQRRMAAIGARLQIRSTPNPLTGLAFPLNAGGKPTQPQAPITPSR